MGGLLGRLTALNLVWLLRAPSAYVPRRPVPFPADVEAVRVLPDLEDRRHALLRNLTFAALFTGVIPASSGMGAVSFFPPEHARLLVMGLLVTSLVGFVLAGLFLQAHHTRDRHDRFVGVLVRLSVARRGRLGSPAAWLLDDRVWRHSLGRLAARRLSPVELEVALALAGEWEGPVGSLLEAAPALVTAP